MFNFVKKTAKSAKRATVQINGNKKTSPKRG